MNYPIASIFYQNNYFILHASAVEFKKKIFCFPGGTMAGKSSLAALLISAGGRLISEDVCIFKLRNNSAYILPSYSFIKLSDEVNNILELSKERAIKFSKKNTDRKGYKLEEKMFCNSEKQVNYFIAPYWNDKKEYIIETNNKHSMDLLFKNSFFKRHSDMYLKNTFKIISSIINTSKLYKFYRKKDLSLLKNSLIKIEEIINES